MTCERVLIAEMKTFHYSKLDVSIIIKENVRPPKRLELVELYLNKKTFEEKNIFFCNLAQISLLPIQKDIVKH